MEKFTEVRTLPSCRVTRRLVSQIESYLQTQIPKVLKKELASMTQALDLRSSRELLQLEVVLQDKAGIRELPSVAALDQENFPPTTRRLAIHFKAGRPEILGIRIVFEMGSAPTLHLATLSKPVKALFGRIEEHLRQVLGSVSNRNSLFHHRLFQALLVLAIPAGVSGYGHLTGTNLFFLYASQGWLLLLSGLFSLALARLFPLVTFQTGRRFDLAKIGNLLLLIAVLAGIGAYIGIFFFELGMIKS